VVEAFVPQMLNYESVGGVNFKKGCYPGQEVVARSQFRGTLKRRAFVAHSDSEMAAGLEIFTAHDDTQPVATVVQAAPAPSGGFDAIISGQLAAVEGGSLHLGRSAGPILEVLPLPYALLDDI
jgi:folate-binding protein YgfZ